MAHGPMIQCMFGKRCWALQLRLYDIPTQSEYLSCNQQRQQPQGWMPQKIWIFQDIAWIHLNTRDQDRTTSKMTVPVVFGWANGFAFFCIRCPNVQCLGHGSNSNIPETTWCLGTTSHNSANSHRCHSGPRLETTGWNMWMSPWQVCHWGQRAYEEPIQAAKQLIHAVSVHVAIEGTQLHPENVRLLYTIFRYCWVITSRMHDLMLNLGESLMDQLFINRWKIINGIFILGAKFMLWKLGESTWSGLVSVLISMMYSLCFNQKCWAVVFFHKNISQAVVWVLWNRNIVWIVYCSARKLTAEVGITFLMETQTISAAGTTLWSPRTKKSTLWAIGELIYTDFTDMSLICHWYVLNCFDDRGYPVTLESPPHQHWTWLFFVPSACSKLSG